MQRSTTGTLSSRGARLTRGQNARFVLVPIADLQINTTEMALRVFTFHLFLFTFSSLLNNLPSEARGVVDQLSLSDSSSSWTNHPTAVMCLSPWC
ncbi:hypothetical protein AVEN_136293-1 [Araneus ventricosus]|uniref:Uncharacterized protein n=1 Tax=Araneus ventricosus TaxID=182803 RepID=A0A4Y2R3T4_ARAVE|nr:hypothetical protein AVEN_136293-1 [Araneus ventricosus]